MEKGEEQGAEKKKKRKCKDPFPHENGYKKGEVRRRRRP